MQNPMKRGSSESHLLVNHASRACGIARGLSASAIKPHAVRATSRWHGWITLLALTAGLAADGRSQGIRGELPYGGSTEAAKNQLGTSSQLGRTSPGQATCKGYSPHGAVRSEYGQSTENVRSRYGESTDTARTTYGAGAAQEGGYRHE